MVTAPALRRFDERREPLNGREEQPVFPSRLVIGLSTLVLVLALVAAGAGLLWRDDGSSYTVTSLRGEEVEIYGRDLYRYDTLFSGAGNKGTDAVSLFFGVPLLAVGILLYRRGSLRGGLLLAGALTWFLYVYASYALGAVAYNSMFLVYVALLGTSLYALILTFRSIDPALLSARLSERAPRRGVATFLFTSGLVTFAVWIISPVTALIDGGPPDGLDTNTTLFTTALDAAVIVPAVGIAGRLILRRDPFGYLFAAALLLLEALLAPMIAAQMVSQLSAGVDFTTAEIIGPIAGFTTIALLAIWMLIRLLRALGPEPHLRHG